MGQNFNFSDPSTVIVGAIGEPGQRVFYIHARYLDDDLTIKIEKAQLSYLIEFIAEALADASRPGHLPDLPELGFVVDVSFIAGAMGVSFDTEWETLTLEFEEAVEEDPSRAIIAFSKEQAGALAIQGAQLLQGGRPPCPLCGYPLDPSGHDCPRTNGNTAPKL